MLPDSNRITDNSNYYKFADTGIEKLVDEMVKKGAKKERMVAKIAGGAQMFNFVVESDAVKIGSKNIAAVISKLKELDIPILSSDCGGDFGRNILFYPETGELIVLAAGKSINI